MNCKYLNILYDICMSYGNVNKFHYLCLGFSKYQCLFIVSDKTLIINCFSLISEDIKLPI